MSRTGYVVGPTLAPDERPWPLMWESDPRIDNGHGHIWETCLLSADGKHRVRVEEVVRCMVCHAPRCGHSVDRNPCMERHHHRVCHRFPNGATEHVGTPQTCGCTAHIDSDASA